jgi:transposase
VVTRGPSQDSPQFPAAVCQAARLLTPCTLLSDAGYDAEHNHRPVPKGKPGSKHYVLVDHRGTPLAAEVTAANVHDSPMLGRMLDAVVPVRTGRRERPRRRPDKLGAEKGYDYRCCRRACTRRGIGHRIARRGMESPKRLGRHRWVAERTTAWLARYRRLAVRHERLVRLTCAFICLNQLHRL